MEWILLLAVGEVVIALQWLVMISLSMLALLGIGALICRHGPHA